MITSDDDKDIIKTKNSPVLVVHCWILSDSYGIIKSLQVATEIKKNVMLDETFKMSEYL